jgi:hypothetical protein
MGLQPSSDRYFITVPGRGRMRRSRFVMEEHLCRKLLPEEVVHHIDENPANDDISNLQLLPNQSEHMKIHRPNTNRKRKEAPSTMSCAGCADVFDMSEHQRYSYRHGRRTFYCDLDCYRENGIGKRLCL